MLEPTRFTSACTVIALSVLVPSCAAFAEEPPPAGAPAEAEQDPPARVGRLARVSGAVMVRPAGADDWTEAPLNRPIVPGDDLWTSDGVRAVIQLGTTQAWLDSNTQLTVLAMDEGLLEVRLAQGRLAFDIVQASDQDHDRVDVATPAGTMTAHEPGRYRVDVVGAEGERSLFSAESGEAEVNLGSRAFDLRAGKTIELVGGDQPTYDIKDWVPAEAFDRYVAGERQAMPAPAEQVPAEMVGAQELGQAGTWDRSSEGEAVWYPNGVADDWAPYRYGSWQWIAPWGWTWIDNAPWGFAPFHYGRWARIGPRWAWYPGRVIARPIYAPCLVAWVDSPGGVAWFPLGPREVFVPRYRASLGYVRYMNVAHVEAVAGWRAVPVGPVAVVNRVHVTVIGKETFVNARPITRTTMLPAVSVQARVVSGPAFEPTRQSRLGPALARPELRPPAAVVQRKVIARLPEHQWQGRTGAVSPMRGPMAPASPPQPPAPRAPPPPAARPFQHPLVHQTPEIERRSTQLRPMRQALPPPRPAMRPAPHTGGGGGRHR